MIEGLPHVTIGDDVVAQHRLVTEKFGIEQLQLVLGWSMGAEQTYEWAVRYPDMVRRAAPFAGTAKTTPHDYLWVTAHEYALKSDPNFNNGFYEDSRDCHAGLRLHSQLWGVMGLCQEFYKQEAWREVGFSSLQDFQHGFWDAYFLPMDPNNLFAWDEMAARRRQPAHQRRPEGGAGPHQGAHLRDAVFE
jgi:homoserine O-acetyltransferase